MLSSLSADFWTAYDRCHVAHKACKDVETKIDKARQKQREVCQELGTQIGMCQRTREFRTAQAEYRVILHQAQDERAISESEQSSNLRDHSSDGYSPSTLQEYGWPISEKKEAYVQGWMDNSDPPKPAVRLDAEEGKWVANFQAMEYGEDPEYFDGSRRRKLIDECDRERARLREAGPFQQAENDFHPDSRDTQVEGVANDATPDGNEPEFPMGFAGGSGEDNARQSPNSPNVRNDLGASPADQAINGYDGENTDGIE